MKVVAIVQSRMGSTRLPGKSLAELTPKKSLLEHILERLKQCKAVDSIVVATTTNEKDQKIVELAEKLGFQSFRGPEDDVLKRFLLCAQEFGASHIVRICGDSPLISPGHVDQIVKALLDSGADYAANSFGQKPLVLTGLGLAVEAFSFKALKKADGLAKQALHRDSVTMFFYKHPEIFRLKLVEIPEFLKNPGLRLTIDTKQDLDCMRQIYNALYSPNSLIKLEKVVAFLERQPEIFEGMKQVNSENPKKAVA